MKIAAAVNLPTLDAIIPDTLEQAAGLLIFDHDTASKQGTLFVTENFPAALTEHRCEAILCGDIYDPPLFDAIADAGITRYLAKGQSVQEAAEAMNAYRLPLIQDYVGGPGCNGAGHGHSHTHGCGGGCAGGCGGGCSHGEAEENPAL